jgi:hypothetical protein
MIDSQQTSTRIENLERGLEDLKARTAQMQQSRPTIVPIQSLEPAPLAVTKTILAVVQQEDETFIASFFDANINASGETQLEAVEMLKDMIASTFRLLTKKETVLGEGPKKQLAVLRQFVRVR